MTCRSCIYWNGIYDSEKGKCTRYPVWVETSKNHFCGEIKQNMDYHYDRKSEGRKPTEQIMIEHRSYLWKCVDELRESNTELRKEIKSLRQLYKKTVGKNAVIRSNKDGKE